MRFCDDGAVVFHFDLVLEDLSLRLVADGDEHAFGVDLGEVAGFVSTDHRAADRQGIILADDFADFAIPDWLDFRVIGDAFLQQSFGAHLVAAVDEENFGCKFCEEQGFFSCGVAAADDDDFFIAIEEAITSCAGGNTEAFEFFFRRQPQPFCLRAGRDDEAVASPERAAICGDAKGRLCEFSFNGDISDDLNADIARLFFHLLHEPRALDDISEAGVIFDIGGDGELSAWFDALEQNRLAQSARGVDSGGETGGARAEDQDGRVSSLAQEIFLYWTLRIS